MIRFFKNLLRREATSASSHAGRSSDDSEKIANKSSTPLMYADNPIRNSAQDVLGRAQVAIHFAEQILSLDASEGVVVGVLGPWGSGKTSLINLARHEFERSCVPILEFNPWMFSGAEQLVESFFVELAAQLRIRPG